MLLDCVGIVLPRNRASGRFCPRLNGAKRMCERLSTSHVEFPAFCGAVRQWLASAPFLDPPLVAAADLLERRATSGGVWFECEVAQIARAADDTHAVLGAGVLLGLWHLCVKQT